MDKIENRIEKFLSQYHSKKTVHVYKWALSEYFKIIYGNNNIEENSEKYFTENRNYEEDLKNFLQAISSSPPLTVRLMIAAVKSFLIENNVELSQKFWKGLIRKIRGSRAATVDEVPSNEQLKSIIAHVPIQGKALFLTLSSSGMRIGETLQLVMEDIELDREPAKITLRREYTKTGNSRITFISSEAKEAIQEWLKVRQNYLVAAVAKSKTRPNYKEEYNGKNLDDNRLFPFDVPTAYYMWNNALKKSGFMKKDNGTKRTIFHPHVLRKFFRSQMATLIPVDVTEALMGHEGYLTEVYRKYSPEQLAALYLKGEPSILVFGNGTDVTELRENLKGVDQAIRKVSEDLETKNKQLSEKVLSLEEEVSNHKIMLELSNNQIKEMYEYTHKRLDPALDAFLKITCTPEGYALWRKIQAEELDEQDAKAREAEAEGQAKALEEFEKTKE
jgi:integrase